MKIIYPFFLLVILSISTGTKEKIQNKDSIQPYKGNLRYWQYKGEPVLLLGGSKTDHFFLVEDLKEHIDEIAGIGGNFVRNTMSQREGWDLKPYKLLTDSTFDLNIWNKDYWGRFSNMLKWTNDKNIIVQIEVWDRFDYSRENWQSSPWNPINNNNYTEETSGLATEYPLHPGSDVQPFFHSIKGMDKYNAKLDIIRKYQEKFVNKMLSYSLDYGNVLYCMNNETSTPLSWGKYWMNYIQEKAGERQIYTTDMFDGFYRPHKCESCLEALINEREYMFLDVSQINSRLFGQNHWDTLNYIMTEREKYELRPINCTKIYGGGNSTWGSGTNEEGAERFCRNVMGGCAAVRHHRPPSGNGFNKTAQATIKAIRKVESMVKFWDIKPKMEVISNKGSNEAYVSGNDGNYVVYFPKGGKINTSMMSRDQQLEGQWISTSTGDFGDKFLLKDEVMAELVTPDTTTGWIAVLIKKN